MSTTLLVDANNVAMRSLHAFARSGLSADGVSTGPLLGFINALSKHIREEKPDRVVVAWDGGRSEHRVALDPAYKAHRLSMEPDAEEAKGTVFALAKEFCTLAGIHHVERPGIEADDLIAHYTFATQDTDRVVILSSDKDFLMLLSDRTVVRIEQVRLSSAGTPTDRWTAQRVREEWGCEPHHLAYAMALAGDDSDGVPGVRGFGMKTAIKTLAKADWDFDAVLREHPKVVEHAERARLNLALVDLRKPLPGLDLAPLPLFRPTGPGDVMYEHLVSFLTKYQIKSVQSRLYDGTLWE